MVYRRNGQNSVGEAHSKNFCKSAREGMQHQRAVRVDDTFRKTSGSGGVAHRRAVILVDLRITKIIAGLRKHVLVIQESLGDTITSIRHDNDMLEWGILMESLVDRQEHIIN